MRQRRHLGWDFEAAQASARGRGNGERGVCMCKDWRLEVTAEGLKPWLAQWLELREKAGQGLGLREGKHPVECTVGEGLPGVAMDQMLLLPQVSLLLAASR